MQIPKKHSPNIHKSDAIYPPLTWPFESLYVGALRQGFRLENPEEGLEDSTACRASAPVCVGVGRGLDLCIVVIEDVFVAAYASVRAAPCLPAAHGRLGGVQALPLRLIPGHTWSIFRYPSKGAATRHSPLLQKRPVVIQIKDKNDTVLMCRSDHSPRFRQSTTAGKRMVAHTWLQSRRMLGQRPAGCDWMQILTWG
jgi:hypothetical protein